MAFLDINKADYKSAIQARCNKLCKKQIDGEMT